MKLSDYLNSWSGAQHEVRFHRISNSALLLLCLVLAIGWMSRHEVVIVDPPPLAKQSWISNDAAADDIMVQWGIAISELLGNVTPGSAKYLKDSLAPMLTPRAYHQVLDSIESQAAQIHSEEVTVHFSPTSSTRDPKNGHVLVSGDLTTTGVRGNAEHESRTYDMTLVVFNYRILIDDINVYKGDAKHATE